MGSCVSVHKNQDSAIKFQLSFGSKNDKLVVPSPVTRVDRTIADLALKSQWSPARPVTSFRDYGSKDEIFFDSQPWLESDCDDDFVSVNGEFTPSRGSTPVHHKFSAGTPARVDTALIAEGTSGSILEESPTDTKKRLSELFQESLRGYQSVDEQNAEGNENGIPTKVKAEVINLVPPPKSADGTLYISGANSGYSSERTPNAVSRQEEDKSSKSAQCCIPRFLSNRSFNERKKKTSPAHSSG